MNYETASIGLAWIDLPKHDDAIESGIKALERAEAARSASIRFHDTDKTSMTPEQRLTPTALFHWRWAKLTALYQMQGRPQSHIDKLDTIEMVKVACSR